MRHRWVQGPGYGPDVCLACGLRRDDVGHVSAPLDEHCPPGTPLPGNTRAPRCECELTYCTHYGRCTRWAPDGGRCSRCEQATPTLGV